MSERRIIEMMAKNLPGEGSGYRGSEMEAGRRGSCGFCFTERSDQIDSVGDSREESLHVSINEHRTQSTDWICIIVFCQTEDLVLKQTCSVRQHPMAQRRRPSLWNHSL